MTMYRQGHIFDSSNIFSIYLIFSPYCSGKQYPVVSGMFKTVASLFLTTRANRHYLFYPHLLHKILHPRQNFAYFTALLVQLLLLSTAKFKFNMRFWSSNSSMYPGFFAYFRAAAIRCLFYSLVKPQTVAFLTIFATQKPIQNHRDWKQGILLHYIYPEQIETFRYN